MGQVAGTFGIIIMQPARPVAFRQSSFHSRQPQLPCPIAVFVLATTVISLVYLRFHSLLPPQPPLRWPFASLANCSNCPAKLPLRCWRFSFSFSQRIAPGHMAGHNPHTSVRGTCRTYALPTAAIEMKEEGASKRGEGTALMTLQTNESVDSLMALPIKLKWILLAI